MFNFKKISLLMLLISANSFATYYAPIDASKKYYKIFNESVDNTSPNPPPDTEIDTSVTIMVGLDDITEDDIVTAAESSSNIEITGIIYPGNYEDNFLNVIRFVLVINGTDYEVTNINVNDGFFSVNVSGSDLFNNNQLNPNRPSTARLIGVKVSATDEAGNLAEVNTVAFDSVDGVLDYMGMNYNIEV